LNRRNNIFVNKHNHVLILERGLNKVI